MVPLMRLEGVGRRPTVPPGTVPPDSVPAGQHPRRSSSIGGIGRYRPQTWSNRYSRTLIRKAGESGVISGCHMARLGARSR